MAGPPYEPQDPDFEQRVRRSFARQRVMETLGATLRRIEPGLIEIEIPFREEFTQQHGFVHAGIVATVADSACGFAAFSLMPPDAGVLAVEFKVNLLSPALGDALVARGRVRRAGRTISVCEADVFAIRDGEEKPIATMIGTIMTIRDRAGVEG